MGLIVDGLFSLAKVGGAIFILPITLIGLGFPAWFAIPIGTLAEILTGIGIIQFATQRRWE